MSSLRRQLRTAALAAWSSTCLVALVSADDSAAPQPSLNFARHIQPLLAARCGECHSKQKRSGKLNLATPEGLARGGENGPALAPGTPDESPLWQRVAADEMPPENPLTAEEKRWLHDWIATGAPGVPRRDELPVGSDHWAFRPVRIPPVPAVDHFRVRNDIDRFVLEKLQRLERGLASPADRETLLRRVALDLTGLPPTPAEIAEYQGDDNLSEGDEDTYARMVERFLASPRYGQRWGKYWLDAAGYADSNGYFNADTDRPLAYKYRDWVIRALNDDLPFDRFLQMQIAGDELVGYAPQGDVTPEMIEALTATHFLRNSQDGTGESDGNDLEQTIDRYTVLEGTVQIMGSALLGLTLQCCRCHDHKFEPIAQRDYYSLQAILRPAYSPDQWLKPAQRVIEVGTVAERQAHRQQNEAIDGQVKAAEQALAEAARPFERPLIESRLAALSEQDRAAVLEAYDAPSESRSDRQNELLKQHEEALKTTHQQLGEKFPEFEQLRKSSVAEVSQYNASRPQPLEKIAVVTDWVRQPSPHPLLVRGDYASPGEEAPPAPPAELTSAENPFVVPAESGPTTGRRLALAHWLAAPHNPLVARVTVNRIWQQHFGRGLVATADNFGYTGAEPTHPELLDYLAGQFVDHGWSQKWLHRLILNSAVYRQTSRVADGRQQADPENNWLERFSLRRLDAEAIRDSTLAVSGELDTTMGGPYVPTKRSDDGHVLVAGDQPGAHRRAVYLQQRRTQVESMLGVFDAPTVVTNCVVRGASTVPLQSLTLLNSEFIRERATALAARLARESGPRIGDRLEYACQLAWGRLPRDDERTPLQEFLADRFVAGDGAALPWDQPASAVEQSAWTDLCQMLLASNQFLYVE